MPAAKSRISKSPTQTKKLARDLAASIQKSTIIALKGDLGSGKTTFVKGLAEFFGIKKAITSPTFALLKHYNLSGVWRGWIFYHFDLYRLKKKEDFLSEGFEDIFKRPRSIVLVEWPEIMGKILPKKRIEVSFAHSGKSSKSRIIKIK